MVGIYGLLLMIFKLTLEETQNYFVELTTKNIQLAVYAQYLRVITVDICGNYKYSGQFLIQNVLCMYFHY